MPVQVRPNGPDRSDHGIGHAAAPGHEPAIFSTTGLPDARRIELWESHNAAALIGLDCSTTSPGPLEATELNVAAGDVRLARVTGSAHTVERSARVIRRSPADAIAVYLTLRGDAWFEQAGQARTLRPGQLLICDADQPFGRMFARGLEELAIKVPRAAFSHSTGLGCLPSVVTVSFARDGNPYGRALAVLAGRATRAGRTVPADERTMVELVAVLAAGRAADPSLAHRAAACSFIEGRLTDQALTAARVAAAIGISERHLSRVFAAAGTSIPRYVLSRRLALGYAMLADPSDTSQSVAEVAARCGFVSATYFCRAFGEYFGGRASQVRRSRAWPDG